MLGKLVIKGIVFTRRIISASSGRRDGAIGVEAEIVEDTRRLK
ncbi:MAG: hypothetical protein PHW54_06210 [Candidatus Omnitrophica bacterium]|nr:hypothetical protein [Candidatus Omnitrophota bacterium]